MNKRLSQLPTPEGCGLALPNFLAWARPSRATERNRLVDIRVPISYQADFHYVKPSEQPYPAALPYRVCVTDASYDAKPQDFTGQFPTPIRLIEPDQEGSEYKRIPPMAKAVGFLRRQVNAGQVGLP